MALGPAAVEGTAIAWRLRRRLTVVGRSAMIVAVTL